MNSSQNLISNLVLSSNLAVIQDLIPDQDLILNLNFILDILNQINDIPTHICKVKEFLQKNLKELLITAAHIYNLSELLQIWSQRRTTRRRQLVSPHARACEP